MYFKQKEKQNGKNITEDILVTSRSATGTRFM